MNTSRGPGSSVAAVPNNHRIYAIGDIHGCTDLLTEIYGKIAEDNRCKAPAEATIVHLGDYIDRGPDSRGVIDFLLSNPQPWLHKIWLKGNHEDHLMSFCAGEAARPSWFRAGAMSTFRSYGVAIDDPPDAPMQTKARDVFRAALRGPHEEFLQNLPISYVAGDYFFVHAGVRPGVPFERQTEADMVWIRDPFLSSDEDFGKVVVHGHTITDKPVVRANRIGIDTGAVVSGKLTCLVLEGTSQQFLTT